MNTDNSNIKNNKGNKSKGLKITYWVTTLIIALFELSGAFFMNSEMAKAGMQHLMLPDWFAWEVGIGHLIGGVLLLVPVGKRLKEWTYVAFGIDFISAFIAYFAVDGWTSALFSPLLFMALLIISYLSYHKLQQKG